MIILSNLEITDEEIDYLFDIIDGTSIKGGIGYTEFLMACIDQKLLFTKDKEIVGKKKVIYNLKFISL